MFMEKVTLVVRTRRKILEAIFKKKLTDVLSASLRIQVTWV